MKLTEDTILYTRVTEVVDREYYLGISKNSKPTSIVAECIHYVSSESGLNINPNDISRQCNVSTPTIKKVCNKLLNRVLDLTI